MNKRMLTLAFLLVLLCIPAISRNGENIHTNWDDYSVYQWSPSAGENWLTGWGYRKQISITGNAASGTNHQLEFFVHYGSGSDSGKNVYCGSKCQNDFDDIRFTDDDGDTLLDYYRGPYTLSTQAEFWVEVADDLTSNQIIYIYYGKTGVSTGSNGDNTFIFFDDFEDNDLTEWTLGGSPNPSITNTIVHTGTYACYLGTGGGYMRGTFASPVTHPVMVHVQSYSDDSYRGTFHLVYSSDGTNDGCYWSRLLETGTSKVYYYDGVYRAWTGSPDAYNDDTYYEFEGGFDQNYAGGDPDMRLFMEGTFIGEEDHHEGDDTDFDQQDIGMIHFSATAGYNNYIDDVWVRRWCITEPSVSSYGAEQEEPFAPQNDQAPTLDNAADTDNMYAHYVKHQITVYVSDPNGYANIDYLEIGLWDDTQTTEYWRGRYDEDTDTFSEQFDGGTYVELDAGSSSATESGDDIDATFYITIDWDFPDNSDMDAKCYVLDADTLSDTDWYEVNWDVETRLDFSLSYLNKERGNYDTVGVMNGIGTIIYLSGTVHPPTDAIDVWVTCPDTPDTDWQATNYEATGGTFSVAVDSDDVVGLDTYTFKAVEEGGGSGGTDLSHATHTDTFIADRLIVMAHSLNDYRIDIGTFAYGSITLHYDYDDTDVEDGTLDMPEASSESYIAFGVWTYTTSTKSTVQAYEYGSLTMSGNTHGVTKYTFNGNEKTLIWDRVNLALSANYGWSVINYNVTLSATGVFAYDSSAWSGTVSWTDRYPVESTVGTYEYGSSSISSITDPTYGLSEFAVSPTVNVIFDDVIPTSSVPYHWDQYSVNYVNLIWGYVTYWKWEYNDTWVSAGTVLHAYSNGSTPEATGGTYGSGAFGGFSVGPFDVTWYYLELTVNCEATVGSRSFDFEVWSDSFEVEILHSLQIVSFNIVPTDDYFWIQFQSNLLNCSITIWDDAIDSGTLYTDAIYTSDHEGFHQIARSTVLTSHNVTICINSDGVNYGRTYTSGSWVWWYNFTYVVSDTYGWAYVNPYFPSGIGYPLETFQLYVNGTRVYDRDWKFYGQTAKAFEICVKDFYGAEIYNTTHSWARGIDILIPVYEFSVSHMLEASYVAFTLTGPNGQVWNTIIHPNDVVRFYLHTGDTYTFSYAGIFNASADSTPDYKTYTGSVTISGATGLVIVSWGLDKILTHIITYQGGGGVTPWQLNNTLSSFRESVITPLQNGYVFFGLILVIMNGIIVLRTGTSTSTHTTTVKSESDKESHEPVPTQLQPYQYKKGEPQDKDKQKRRKL